jgi:hypothetical protein
MAKPKKGSPRRTPQTESWFSKLSPTKQDLLCIAVLYVVTLILFRSIVFENAAFASGDDTAAAFSYAHAGNMIEKAEGVDVLWMPYFFSGMPTFGNVAYLPHNVSYLQETVVPVLRFLYLNSKWGWYVVYYLFCGLFMFFLARVWNLPRAAALFAALTFMLSPYGIGLAAEGHGSKLMALSYLPLVVLLTHLLFERRDLLSFGLLSAGIGTLMLTNHMQIVYYGFIVLALYLLYHVVLDLKQQTLLAVQKVVLFIGALLIGFCISSYIYLSVYEYAQYSIRGGGTTGAPGGLAWDYATNWSFDPWELLTLFVPSFFGFSSRYLYIWQGQLTKLPLYWGTMPFNTSTVYVGLLPMLLSLIALVYRRNRTTMFLAILSLLVLLMSFGKHFSLFYQLLFNYLPFFNKFRAPAMVLHLLAFAAALLGAYGLEYLFRVHDEAKAEQMVRLKKALVYGVLGLALLLLVAPQLYGIFGGQMYVQDGESYGQQTAQVLAELKKIRAEILWNDFVKFLIVAGASIAVVWLYLSKKIRPGAFSGLVLGILLVDLVIMDSKFINPQPGTAVEESFQPTATIRFLKQDTSLFRVFPMGQPLFMDNTFAYHGLQSIGGYSPAKLKIYQTMIDSCLYEGPDPSFPLNMNIVDMLNVRYLVVQGQLPTERLDLVYTDEAERTLTYKNPHALPRAFVLGKVIAAANQSEVFSILNSASFDPATTAVLEKPLSQPVSPPDSASAVIREYASRRIVVDAYSSTPALLVLGEIYYPAGWKAFVDGQETEIFKTNYILRSVRLPAGSHEVLFTFNPPLYRLGWIVSNGAWVVTLLCVLVGAWRLPSLRRWVSTRLHRTAGTSVS